MKAYFDSAIILKLYVQEANSADAIRLVSNYSSPYLLTAWQALEVRNAIRLKCFRKEITHAEMVKSIGAFEQDITANRWVRPNYRVAAIEEKTEELSRQHSEILGCRTLDIIHVAAAIMVGAKDFITFDLRQSTLAARSGLMVKS